MTTPNDPKATHGKRAPVLVAGAAGFLGRSIVRALTESGWPVRGLVRDVSKGVAVTAAGGVPVLGDVLEPQSLREATHGCHAIVHVAANPGDEPGIPDLPERVRVEGARNLAMTARENRVRRLVVGSGYWVYATRATPIDEGAPVDPQGESKINYLTERSALSFHRSNELDVMIVRPGMVYGAGSWFRPVVNAIQAGTYRVIEGGKNPWSFVSLVDAGTGFCRVLEAGVAGQVYNLVDRAPAPWGEFSKYVATKLGCPAPGSCTLAEAEAVYGPIVARHLAASRPAVAAKLEALGWQPSHPTYRTGIDELLGRWGPHED